MQLNDPVHQESVPPVDVDSAPAARDRFRPASLSRTATAFLRQSLARHQRRRRVFHARRLRVCVEGEERWQCDPGAGVSGPFTVPLSASYLEIFGDDADETLLLAVFPLPGSTWVERDGTACLSVTLEGGQTVTIEVALGEEVSGAERAYVMKLTYTESAAVERQG
jgi:hypothetical protein